MGKQKIPPLEPDTPQNKKPADPVQEASEESFPASDPPAHGGVKPIDPDKKPPNPAEGIRPEKPKRGPDKVREASEDSFPASDPPAWGTSHV